MPLIKKDALWDAFATFISAAEEIIEERYWFAIRGDCHMSLCMLSMLTVTEYAIFLLSAELVSLRKRKGGGFDVGTSVTDTWQPLLEQSGLTHAGRNLAEATLTKMEVGGLKKKMRTCNAPQHKSPRKGMHMIGIGRYEKGVTTNAAFQVRDEVALPEYQRHRKLRSAQRRFFRTVKPLLKESPTTNQFRDKVKAVKEWVELQILEEEFKAHYPGTDDIHSEAGGASNVIAPSHSDTTT